MFEERNNFSQITEILFDIFTEMLQCKLSKVTFLGKGKNYVLPSITVKNYPEDLYTEKDFKNLFLGTMIETNHKNQRLVYDYIHNDGLSMELFFTGRSYHPISLMNLISNLRMDFYYFLFDKIEHKELNYKMNKYFGKSNKRISSKDYKWIVNKVRAINDNKIHNDRSLFNPIEIKKWKQYRDGKEVELEFFTDKFVKKYEIIYSECLNHIKVLYGLQKENLIICLAAWSLIFSIIGILATIIIKLWFSSSTNLSIN